MGRKKRSFVQGSIQQIYDLFFKQIVKHYKPEDISVVTFLENLFDVDYRNIYRCEVVRDFRIPGLLYVAGSIKMQGIGTRDVKEGSIVFVREDLRTSSYDVECYNGVGHKEQVFSLTSTEWNKVAPHLKKVDQAS